jgi:hypothetical protein
VRAIASFERTLLSFDAPYDRAGRGEPGAMNAAAARGQELFFSVAQFLPKAGVFGLVLLLDEMDVVFNARGKALENLLNNMRTLIDQPDHRMNRTPLFGMFATPPLMWDEIRARNYEALKQRFRVSDPFHLGCDDAPQIDLGELGTRREILRAIGEKLLELGIRVHGWHLDLQQQRRNLEKLVSVTAGQLLEVNALRLFVKAWCSLLGEQGRNGGQDYTEGFLVGRIRGVNDEVTKAEQVQPSNDIG